jgi:hypothetical protein
VGEVKVTVDRLEGDMAVLLLRNDERIKFNLPINLLPEGVHEGDILDISITIDEGATDESKSRVSSLIERLKSKKQEDSSIIQDPGD